LVLTLFETSAKLQFTFRKKSMWNWSIFGKNGEHNENTGTVGLYIIIAELAYGILKEDNVNW